MNKSVDFYFVRHGQTLFNKLDRMQGWCDSPLTELGIQQAKDLGYGLYLKGIQFNYAFSSNTERAFDTAKIVTNSKIPVHRKKRLKEVFFGDCEGEYTAVAHEKRNTRFEIDWSDVGGETFEIVKNRMSQQISNIFENASNGDKILIVSHGGSITAYLSQYKNFDYDKIINSELPPLVNCSIAHVKYTESGSELIKYNDKTYKELGHNNTEGKLKYYESFNNNED